MPLLPSAVMRYSSFSSKSRGLPPRQMRNVLLLITVPGVISPTSAPSSTRQYSDRPPTVERLAVEDRLEAGLVAVQRRRPVALLRRVAGAAVCCCASSRPFDDRGAGCTSDAGNDDGPRGVSSSACWEGYRHSCSRLRRCRRVFLGMVTLAMAVQSRPPDVPFERT